MINYILSALRGVLGRRQKAFRNSSSQIEIELDRFAQAIANRPNDEGLLYEVVENLLELLQRCNREREPILGILVLQHLGNALYNLGDLTREQAFLQRSVEQFRVSLQLHSQLFPKRNWPIGHINLGSALRRLGELTRDHRYLEEAADEYNEVLRMTTKEEDEVEWARVHISLGAILYSLGTLTNNANHLEEAADDYGIALQIYTREQQLIDWAKVQTALGETLSDLCDLVGPDTERLKSAVCAYEKALNFYSQSDYPKQWAKCHFSRGLLLNKLAEVIGDPQYLVESIAAFRASLQVYTFEYSPEQWAATKLWIAGALVELSKASGERQSAYLAEAIAVYQEVQENCDREANLKVWIEGQSGMGVALSRLGESNDDVNLLEDAVSLLSSLLQVLPPGDTRWASIQNNLGAALRRLGTLTRNPNRLKDAESAFRKLLEIYTRENDPEDWAMTQSNLGGVLMQLCELAGDFNRFEQAGHAFTQALKIYTPETAPRKWAYAQECLGNILINLSRLYRDQESAELVVAGSHELLSRYSRQNEPRKWARMRWEFGVALRILGNLTNDRGRHREAAEALRDALQVYTLEDSPLEYVWVIRDLGAVLLELQEWADAETAITPILEVTIPLVQSQSSVAQQRHMVRQFNGLGEDLAYSLIRQGRPLEALRAQTGLRTILLQGSLALNSIPSRSSLVEARNRWQEAQKAAVQADSLLPENADPAIFEQHNRLRRQLEGEVRKTFEEFRKVSMEADLVQSAPFDLGALSLALPEGGALVAPFAATGGGAILLLRHGESLPHVLLLDNFSRDESEKLLAQFENGELSGWVKDYNSFVTSKATIHDLAVWNAAIHETLHSCSDLLMKPLDWWLREIGILPGAQIIMMLPGRLSPIPLHAAPTGTDRVFLDDWIVSYTPDPRTLITSKFKSLARMRATPSLLAVTNPTGDLPLKSNPGWDLFASDRRHALVKEEATRDAVLASLPGFSHLSFYCHGSWNASAPDESALIMADLPLTVADFRNVDLSAGRLAVLAACETGLSDWKDVPDEFIGLPAALLEAGIPCIVASLWPVEASATQWLVERFFSSQLGGKSPAASLREAQLDMRRAIGADAIGSINHREPFFWAAFTVTGA
jgi:tetratricopeptide (TPR) repeat protein